jgi:hypothetical protein
MELPNPDPITGRPEHGGRDRHAAFSIHKLAPLKARLDAKVRVSITERRYQICEKFLDKQGSACILFATAFCIADLHSFCALMFLVIQHHISDAVFHIRAYRTR